MSPSTNQPSCSRGNLGQINILQVHLPWKKRHVRIYAWCFMHSISDAFFFHPSDFYAATVSSTQNSCPQIVWPKLDLCNLIRLWEAEGTVIIAPPSFLWNTNQIASADNFCIKPHDFYLNLPQTHSWCATATILYSLQFLWAMQRGEGSYSPFCCPFLLINEQENWVLAVFLKAL